MREMLQRHSLTHLGQCDPFEATVDAAIFVARKSAETAGTEPGPPPGLMVGQPPCRTQATTKASENETDRLVFIQVRPRKDANGQTTKPEMTLPLLRIGPDFKWTSETGVGDPLVSVSHADFGPLRVHSAPIALYRAAHKRVFFEPRHATLKLFERFNDEVKRLTDEWWDRIETSQKFADNLDAIRAYHQTLKPGDITLVGLIAEGGQGIATANNARFLGYLEGTPQVQRIYADRERWTANWLKDDRIRPTFVRLLKENGGDPRRPTADGAAWEACIEPMRNDPQIGSARLGFTKSDLYRIVPKALVANAEDFAFAWKRRKAELLKHWQKESCLAAFWQQETRVGEERVSYGAQRTSDNMDDIAFCRLCVALWRWANAENGERRSGQRIPKAALGLRSSEFYDDPADAPRIAAIYNGLSGRGRFVPFRKGDPEGNRWVDNEPLYIDWTSDSVDWLSTAPEARWQGHSFFLREGVTWSLHANHVGGKFRLQPPCVFDASGSRLTPLRGTLPSHVFVALANSDIFSFFLKKFIKV